MKHFFFILLSLLVCFSLAANSSFDSTKNYQGNNATSYLGEVLVVIPIPTFGTYPHNYRWFKDNSFQINPDDSEYAVWLNYKYDPTDYRDYSFNGCREEFLVNRMFIVDSVRLMPNREYVWIFSLIDVKTKERLKFVYHGDEPLYRDFQTFPFMTIKYLQYLQHNLVGKDIVFGTKTNPSIIHEHNLIYWETFKTDYFTKQSINYDKPYAQGTVKEITLNLKYSQLSLIVKCANGHTVEVLYPLHYDPKPLRHNSGTRVFTKAQWESLVKQYGQSTMTDVMKGVVNSNMSKDIKLMAKGR